MVDFSRALCTKRATVRKHYGLTEVDSEASHYLCFRSQGATRYIPLKEGTPLSGDIGVRVVGKVHKTAGYLTFTLYFNMAWISAFEKRLRLTKITVNHGGATLPCTFSLKGLDINGMVTDSNTVTFNAQTTEQTYITTIAIDNRTVGVRCELTINGESRTMSTDLPMGNSNYPIDYKFA